ncbi:MAG: hypothetical protein EOO10_21295 [Chitinophagaceae bacterium]|nr:MAG: hypothetical protein EOO10_21295 [Chitinophagaceae bacterium]
MNKKCNKALFATKEDAKAKLKAISLEPPKDGGKINKRGRPIKPIRVYFCSPCNGWHLTSYSKSKLAAIKRSQIQAIANQWIRKKGWGKDNP